MIELTNSPLAVSAWSLTCLMAWAAALVCAWGLPVGWTRAARWPSRATRRASENADAHLPRVTLLIPALDELNVVAFRIEQALSLDYPKHKLQVVASLEGCDDRLEAAVRMFAGRGVLVIDSLDAGLRELSGDVVIICDDDQPLNRQTLLEWLTIRDSARQDA